MPLIQIEQDGPELLDAARALIAAMANELRKIKARNLSTAQFDAGREKAAVSGYLHALHLHHLLSDGQYSELMTEKVDAAKAAEAV